MSAKTRMVVTSTVVVLFLSAFPLLERHLGDSAGILATLPVVVAAGLFGLSPNPPKDVLGDSP